jgi:hypothetical protein
MSHLVVGSAELEAEYGKQVFPLQEYTTFQAVAKVDSVVERSLIDDIVNAGSQNQPDILYAKRMSQWRVRSSFEGLLGPISHIRIAIGQ